MCSRAENMSYARGLFWAFIALGLGPWRANSPFYRGCTHFIYYRCYWVDSALKVHLVGSRQEIALFTLALKLLSNTVGATTAWLSPGGAETFWHRQLL